MTDDAFVEYRATLWWLLTWLALVAVQLSEVVTGSRGSADVPRIAVVSAVLFVVLAVIALPTRVFISQRGVGIRFSFLRFFVPLANASTVVVQKRLGFAAAYLVRRDGARIRLPAVSSGGRWRVNWYALADDMNEKIEQARAASGEATR